jgi:hypothetical protein
VSADAIGLDSIIVLSADTLSANLDDEIVLLNQRTSRYHAVHGAGNHIFHLLDQRRSVRELCDALTAKYEVPDDVCQREVLEFIRTLVREELAVVT